MRSKTPLLFLLAALTVVPNVNAFEVVSKDVKAGKPMSRAQEYQGFDCNGGNTSPQLAWKDAPAGTRSFALTVHDPDVPSGSGWWHWLIFNIPADVRELPAGAGDPASGLAPAGSVQSRNDFGTHGYGGACPPKGESAHHYQFKLFALDVERLEIGPDSSGALVGYLLNAHKLGVVELEALYKR